MATWKEPTCNKFLKLFTDWVQIFDVSESKMKSTMQVPFFNTQTGQLQAQQVRGLYFGCHV